MPAPKRKYDCTKCPGYCCSYDWIEVTARDVARLARHFGVAEAVARERFTKLVDDGKRRVLRHKQDHVFKTTCMFFDQDERRCTIYAARPGVCREYPVTARCGYYDFLLWERDQQGDEEFIPGHP
ncbi:MAG: YkgJ family cysteine cluster protein [Burkholderiales bacterium]|nr:YkgJ family cysteine cluster protein [Burkholderiales bacterium]